MKFVLIIFSAFVFVACNQQGNNGNAQGEWITGSAQEQLNTIEKQFRGFDLAMVETGYRYRELYWAGQDENWEYADYQLEKIKVAIENGFERRPLRAQSAEHFMQEILPGMKRALEKRDSASFNQGFQILTANCNSCHALEDVSFFNVQIPETRHSPIKK